MERLLKVAHQGDTNAAQYNLGLAYINGKGAPQDDSKAVKWFLKAAYQGVAIAQYNLGVMHMWVCYGS